VAIMAAGEGIQWLWCHLGLGGHYLVRRDHAAYFLPRIGDPGAYSDDEIHRSMIAAASVLYHAQAGGNA
jgi:hypothetical protein